MKKKISSELDKMNLLKRALNHLGLKLEWWGFQDGKARFLAVDGDSNLYMWYKENHYVVGNYNISRLEDFLSAKRFEYYGAVRRKLIENPFFGLSPEELAIKIDLLEA